MKRAFSHLCPANASLSDAVIYEISITLAQISRSVRGSWPLAKDTTVQDTDVLVAGREIVAARDCVCSLQSCSARL